MQVGQGEMTPWHSYDFAADWYADAKREASDLHHLARRREILFAVACAESYPVEWVRDDVLKHQHPSLSIYFPPGTYSPIVDKWKEVPKQLEIDGRTPAAPNLGCSSVWAEFLGPHRVSQWASS